MAKIFLISEKGIYYKANLHAHTIYSDGALTPIQMKELYQKNGYSVIAFTDHNVLKYHKELDDDKFLALCGYEIDAYKNSKIGDYPKCCHINVILRDPENFNYIERPEVYSDEAVNDAIKRFNGANCIVNLNHPSWSAADLNDYINLKGLSAVEIYNHGCEVLSNDGRDTSHYDIMLKSGMKLNCISTDDNHNWEVKEGHVDEISDSCGGYTMIKAESLSYENIIKSLDSGDFYCSMGFDAPEIYSYYIENNRLCIECSPVKSIHLKSKSIGVSGYWTSSSGSLTKAEFDLSELKGFEGFLRFEIKGLNGSMSFTNPYYL